MKVYCQKCGVKKLSFKISEYEILKTTWICRLCKGKIKD